ncbi:pyrroline-5-carboxylate reductase [Suttonella sp. R2A3]|uniref:pyrroline-5-carboxylate reductase n=1 Tax=Suttonella sp. R2A3 TaxID=2908648 RepID=UPI001F3A68C6|nr:pyrroline-5-carboxylate reductase [Suttonella sp. R2A3]UJF25034.1 pyrroline-5-carboxylate reductase [Suttonella sp. R2A3]
MTQSIIGFIGAGHMSQAVIAGMLSEEERAFQPSQVIATCHTKPSAKAVSERFAIDCRTDNQWLCEQADVIILGVKPQDMHALLKEITKYDLNDKIIITLAAGIDTASYRKLLGDELPIVRTMPNIAAEVQASVTGIYSDLDLDDADTALIEQIISSCGDSLWLDDETQIDGVMAMAGSGIAYFFRFMQAMAQSGERYGFERDEAYDIVTLTALGAASLALENADNNTSFAKLCQQVAVKGGTTAEGINVLDGRDIDSTLRETMDAVIDRARALRDDLTGDW